MEEHDKGLERMTHISLYVNVHFWLYMRGSVHREGSIYVQVKECIAVCDIQLHKERKCISAHAEWYGIVSNCWKIWYRLPKMFYVVYYSQNNVLPNIIFTIWSFAQMQYYLKTPFVNKLTQITSETDVWFGSTENSLKPQSSQVISDEI